MVHQHFMLVPVMTVMENIVLGLNSWRNLIDLREAEHRVKELSHLLGIRVNPSARIDQLPVGVQQQVEILKCLYRGADILILDEPTSVLTPQERDRLFALLRQMVRQGHSIIFITHKLDEVMALADRVTVMRNGKNIATVERRSTNPRELARMMVGRDILFQPIKPPSSYGREILRVEGVRASDDEGRPALRDISLSVREGEILGIAGVDGNGQKELVEVLCGLRKATSGQIFINGQNMINRSPAEIRNAGVAYIPKDGKKVGSIANFSIAENLLLGQVNHPPFSQLGVLRSRPVLEFANRLQTVYNFHVPDIQFPAKSLSGGNLQKLILARELSQSPALLIAEQPTQGLDVGATEYVYERLLEQRQQGTAILLVSTSLDEILALSDRIMVMYEGEIVGEMPAEGADIEEIGLMMGGISKRSSLEDK